MKQNTDKVIFAILKELANEFVRHRLLGLSINSFRTK